MSRRTPFPPSPGLPPSLYSGMSSLQISQAGLGSVAETSFYSHTSQPQKALLKGPKTARHQSRKSEHPSSSAPWKDPRQAVVASAGHKRTVKDDAFYRNVQLIWSPFPPDARPTVRKERDIMLRAVTDQVADKNTRADIFYSDCEQRMTAIEARAAAQDEDLLKLEQTMHRCCQYTVELEHLRRARHMAAQQNTQDRMDRPDHPAH